MQHNTNKQLIMITGDRFSESTCTRREAKNKELGDDGFHFDTSSQSSRCML